MEHTKEKTSSKFSGKLPSSPPGEGRLLWRDLRPGDTFVVPREASEDPFYSGLTYTITAVSGGEWTDDDSGEATNVLVRILTARGTSEEWSGEPHEPYYGDTLVGRGP